jgi:hypothetical protein
MTNMRWSVSTNSKKSTPISQHKLPPRKKEANETDKTDKTDKTDTTNPYKLAHVDHSYSNFVVQTMMTLTVAVNITVTVTVTVTMTVTSPPRTRDLDPLH